MAARGRGTLGFRAHSGWASVVALWAGNRELRVVHRGRLELVLPGPDAVRQPFHAAEGQSPERAAAIVGRSAEEARRLARDGIRELLRSLEASGCPAKAGCLLLASGRVLPDLPAILASHALIHAADGELFRDAIRSAAADCGLPLIGAPEREVWTRASRELDCPPGRLQERIGALGKEIGPPWRQDEKLSAAAALLAMGKGITPV
jgi:hypothetical protein